jgi:hypothetical protein
VIPSGWNVYTGPADPKPVGFVVYADGDKAVVKPTKALRTLYGKDLYSIAVSDKSDKVAMFKSEKGRSLAPNGMRTLTSAMAECGYEIKVGNYFAINPIASYHGFEIVKKAEAISIKTTRRKAKPEAKPAAAEPAIKEYPLPEVEDNGPAEWAQACMLMAQAVPKTTISKEIGVSIADCRILEVQCAGFIAKIKEFEKECKRDMAKGLAKAVIESWERQLRSKAS